MRTRNWGRLATGLVLSTVMALGVLQAPMAQADTAPPVPNDPSNPETVSAQPLPTVQIGTGVVWSQAVVGNTVYVGGQFSTARPAGSAPGTNEVTRSNLLAYDIRTGALLSSWAPSTNGVVNVVTAAPDGSRIYVGGAFTTVNGQTRRRIAALDPSSGALIGAFNPNPDASVRAIAVTPTKVYFGGLFGTAGGQPRTRLAAVDVNGTLLPWAPAAAGGQVAAMVTTPDDGRVIIGGQFTTVNGSGNPGYGLAAIDGTTGALTPFAAAGIIRNGGPNSGITSAFVDEDSIYVTGYHFGAGGNLEGTARINLNGTLNWLEDCHGDTYSVFAARGSVYKVGHAHYCGNVPGGFAQSAPWKYQRGMAFSKQATGVLRTEYLNYFNWAGTKSPSILQWLPQLDAGTFTGQTQAAWSLSGNDDYVVAGGEFPKAEGMNQQGLVRYARNTPQTPAQERPEFSGSQSTPIVTSPATGEVLVSWQTNSDLDNRALTYKVIRGSDVNNPVYTTTRESTVWDRPYLSFVDTGRTPGTTESYRIFATDAHGNESRSNAVSVVVSGTGTATDPYARSVLADGPQSYWRLGESSGTDVADLTGRDPMTTNGTVTRTAAGAISGNGAATFAGNASSTAASTQSQHGPFWFSVEAWFRTSTTTGGRIVGFSGSRTATSGTNQYDRNIYMSNSGQLSFGVHQGSTRATVTSSATYNNNQWHHVVGVVGDTGMSLYVDGANVGTRPDARTGKSYNGYWRLGGDTLSGWSSRPTSDYFNGSIDDVAVYRQALAGNQVRAHYLAAGAALAVPSDSYGKAVYDSGPDLYWRFRESSGTSAADSSLNGQTGTYAGSPTLGGASAVNDVADKSITLNGTTGNVASNNTSLTSPQVYSEEAWIKTTTTTGGQIMGFGSSKTGSSTTYDRQVYMTNAGTLKFAVSPSNVDTSITSPAGQPYNDGKWHHVVATQGPGGMKLYVDGTAVASGSTVNSLSYNGYWRVGGDNLTGRSSKPTSTYFAGSVDEVAVYPKVLSASEVASHFSKAGGTTQNQKPVAAFSSSNTFLAASFDASGSTDPDGSIAAYAWDFGDGTPQGSGKTTSHNYTAAGTYPVTLTVTDDLGATSSVAQNVTVTNPPPNQKPTAAFTSSSTGLTAAFDGSGSADTDGTIASYDWDFGDGTTHGGGQSPTHPYGAPGTYQVTLTVTDNLGDIGTTTNAVTLAGPIAVDSFTRTSASGWGSANAGGAWTPLIGAASNYSVGGGAGQMMVATNATRAIALNDVAATDTDTVVKVSLDQMPTTGGYEYAIVGARQQDGGGYRARVKLNSDGTVGLTLQCQAVTGGTCVKSTVANLTTVSGVTVTAGAQLNIRLQTEGTGTTTLRSRVWLAGTTEPTTWQLTGTDTTAALQGAGGVYLSAFSPSTTTNAIVASWDDLQVDLL